MFEETKILAKTSHYYARLHRESIEIHKHENNFNKKEESLKLNKTWFPALRNRKIGNQSGIAKGRISTNQSPGRTTANEKPGRHSSRQVPGTISTQEKANLHHFRNNS
jgi:hypothetical protein